MNEEQFNDLRDKIACKTITLTPKGRRWVELVKEGLTPNEAMRRVEAEIVAARNQQ